MRGRGRRLFLLLLLLSPLLPAGRPAAAGEEKPAILPHSPIEVAPTRPRPATHYRLVDSLVARLIDLDEWQEEGLSPGSGGGMGFEPGERDRTPPEGDHSASEAFGALAALGPDAIPALLAHLEDETPTELSLYHGGGWGGLKFATEIGANPAMADELAAIRSAFPSGWPDDPARAEDDRFDFNGPLVRQHLVTIGDCCFALLGQITNRVYEAVRYQPTSINVVNSPTRDPRIARAIRKQWEGKDPRVELARRLAADLHTARSDGGWGWDGYRQAGAAERLAFYFPAASAALLAGLTDRIETEVPPSAEEPTFDEEPFVRGLRHSKRPAVRAALLRLVLRTRSIDLLVPALRGIGPRKEQAVYARIVDVLEHAAWQRHGHWARCELLRDLHRRWPALLAETVCRLPRTKEMAWALAELADRDELVFPARAWRPWLEDDGPAVPWTRRGKDRLERLRLCDVAAVQIATQREDLEFDEQAGVDVRDEQIRTIRRVLDAEGLK